MIFPPVHLNKTVVPDTTEYYILMVEERKERCHASGTAARKIVGRVSCEKRPCLLTDLDFSLSFFFFLSLRSPVKSRGREK